MKKVLHLIEQDMGCGFKLCNCGADAWLYERVDTGLWMVNEYLAAIAKLNEPK